MNLARLQRSEAELAWIYSLKLKIADKRAFAGLDVRQLHHWLWRRGFRPDPWMNRCWSSERVKTDDDRKPIRFHVIDGNGYADRNNRISDFVENFSELYGKTQLQVLREVRLLPPRDCLKPFFAVGDLVSLRQEYRRWLTPEPNPTAVVIGQGEVGAVVRVKQDPKRWIEYTLSFEGNRVRPKVHQTDIERAGVLDQVAHASKE